MILILGFLFLSSGCQPAKSSSPIESASISYPENPWQTPTTIFPPSGELDLTFGSSTAGIIDLPMNKTNIWAHGKQITVQSDGKILVTANHTELSGTRAGSGDFKVMRLNEDGSLDTTFNASGSTPGVFIYDFGLVNTGDSLDSTQITIQKLEGIEKIVVGATLSSSGVNTIAVIRLNPDGTLDSTFGLSGKNSVSVTGTNSIYLQSILIQASGKIVLGGYGWDSSASKNKIALARLDQTGSLDTTFNPTGSQPGVNFTNMGCNCSTPAYEFKLLGGDKIMVGGERSLPSSSFLGRFTADGELDTDAVTGYNAGQGYLNLQPNYGLTSFGVNSQGDVIVTGWSNTNGENYVTKVKSDGILDSSFGNNGMSDFFVTSDDWGTHAEFAPDGKILIMHTPKLNGFYRTAITRLNSDGAIDASFGNIASKPGMFLFEATGASLENVSMVILPDQKILVGTHNQNSSSNLYLFKIK